MPEASYDVGGSVDCLLHDVEEIELKNPVATRLLHLTGSALNKERLKPDQKRLEALQWWWVVAHTGNAWEGSPVIAGVLLVLNSWA